MHDAASTPYLALLEAREETTFVPNCSGKTVEKRIKKKNSMGAPNLQDNGHGDCMADLPRLYIYSSPWVYFF